MVKKKVGRWILGNSAINFYYSIQPNDLKPVLDRAILKI
jgi:hypothetical protein